LEINAEYQIENGLLLSLKELDEINNSIAKSRKRLPNL